MILARLMCNPSLTPSQRRAILHQLSAASKRTLFMHGVMRSISTDRTGNVDDWAHLRCAELIRAHPMTALSLLPILAKLPPPSADVMAASEGSSISTNLAPRFASAGD